MYAVSHIYLALSKIRSFNRLSIYQNNLTHKIIYSRDNTITFAGTTQYFCVEIQVGHTDKIRHFCLQHPFKILADTRFKLQHDTL
jgi:hypothetical protein